MQIKDKEYLYEIKKTSREDYVIASSKGIIYIKYQHANHSFEETKTFLGDLNVWSV